MSAQLDILIDRFKEDETASQDREARLRSVERHLAGLSAALNIELIYGGSAKPLAKDEVKLPYRREGNLNTHQAGDVRLYYFTAKGETLGDVAAHPGTLGAWYLWPLLRDENDLKGRGDTTLPEGTLLAVPRKITDWKLRNATTSAGAPDAVRNEILSQAGI
jgi:hypothetical protein